MYITNGYKNKYMFTCICCNSRLSLSPYIDYIRLLNMNTLITLWALCAGLYMCYLIGGFMLQVILNTVKGE